MTDDKAAGLIKAAQRANSKKANWLNILNDVWDYCFPMKQGFYDSAPGEDRMERIFDETPIDAANEFASIIMEGLFGGKWFRLEPGAEIPDEQRDAMQAELDPVNNYIWRLLSQSNLKSEVHNSILEMAASVGNLYIKKGDVDRPLIFKSVSMIHLDYDIDAEGRIDTIYRRRKMEAEEVEVEYPKANIPPRIQQDWKDNPKKSVEVLETCKRLWGEKGTETHEFTVVLVKDKLVIQENLIKGSGSRPWVNFRWSADCDQALGRGPLITALPSIRNLNLVKEMGLENAQLHIGGVFQADDDGTYNFDNVEIVPMSVMSRTPGTTGLEPVKLPGNPDMTQFVVSDLQAAIRMILLNNEFGSLEKTPRSAEEIYGRTGKQMKKIRAPLERLVVEAVIPIAMRVVHLLKTDGRIELPKIDGRTISVNARGPMVRMLRALDNEDMIEFVLMVKQMYGPESKLYVKDDKFISHISKNKEMPTDILVTDTERQTMINEMKEAAAGLEEQQAGTMPGVPQPEAPLQ